MPSYNRVILWGNMTKDPEPVQLPSGKVKVEISLAMNNRRKGADGELVEDTTFVDITFWEKNAENLSKMTKKGTLLHVEGRLKLDTWETDGQKRSKLYVVGERFQLPPKDSPKSSEERTGTEAEMPF